LKEVVAIKLIPLRVVSPKKKPCDVIFIVVSVVRLGVYLCPIMPLFCDKY
jgi:hypothetical protein